MSAINCPNDGNTLYVGAPCDDDNNGSIRVINTLANTWIEQANSIKGINGINSSVLGRLITISTDG